MQRTQIYFEESMLEELKQQANALGITFSAYIRDILQKDMDNYEQKPDKLDLSEFAGLWRDRDITIESIRKDAWK